MRAVTIFSLAFILGLGISSIALAVECDQSCPSGTEMIAFADGNTPSCSCVRPSSAMNPTDETEIIACDSDDDGQNDC